MHRKGETLTNQMAMEKMKTKNWKKVGGCK